ncbi:MAG: tandem-95 repeat protein [Pirellulaceae bacterium]|nr:tandem-95 repeat protein [Pirellulaceae bacterium]
MVLKIRRKLRNFTRKFLNVWAEDQVAKSRAVRFEPLENRQLMAADFFSSAAMASEANGVNDYLSTSGSEVSTSVAEGEAAPDLVAFAKSLRDAGVIFFGADWCPNCIQQKKLFEDGSQFLNFVEVTNPDRTPNTRGNTEGVFTYPTWQFQNGSRQTGVLSLAQISSSSGIAIPTSSRPSITPISATTVLRGSPLHIPIDGYDPNGNPLSYTVSSSNPAAVSAEVLQGNSFARFNTNFGDMVFELFDTEGGRATDRFKQLSQSGFYSTTSGTSMTFHRVIQTFVIQGGDPTATGTGGSTLPDFDDQFNVNLQHNRSGILSYAKSSDDTNDSQFFITAGPTRNLDFNHSIFGQLIEGDDARAGIARTAVNSSDKPINNAIINSVTIFNDTENALVRLRAVGAAGATSTITVTATDTEGNQTSVTFVVTVANDTSNGSPFLNDIPAVNAVAGQPIQITLTSQDKEGDVVRYGATRPSSQTVNYTVSADTASGVVTVTPPVGFVGSFQFLASVNQTPNANANDQNDAQLVTVNVTASATPAPSNVDLSSSSDTGTSSSDNITNAGTMTFVVSGTTSGATVTLRAGSNVIATETATGTSTTITTSNLAALGAGSYQISAIQTINSQASAASPTFALTFDNVAPNALASNSFPSSIPSGQPFTVNLTHPEEGLGLTYTLINAPSGMTVNAQSGIVLWTPTEAQIGLRTFTLQLTDNAGNTRSDSFSITVSEAALSGVRLQLVDVDNNPITSVSVGQSFKVQAIVDDLRTADASGVFAAYFDLNYDSSIVELDGSSPISRLNSFEISPSGTTTTPGLIDDLGAGRSSTTASQLVSVVMLDVRFRAKASGQANFSTDAAEGSTRTFLLYDIDTAIPSNRVVFGNASLAVGRNFTAVNDSFNVNEDSASNSLDVLANDTITPGTSTTITIRSVGTPNAGGSVTISNDQLSVLYTPAANYNGGESFTYVVRDNNGAEATATATIQIQPVNDAPIANPDSFTFIEGSTDNFLNVLSNDNDGVDDNEILTVSAVGTPSAGGTARINGGSNAILYTPRAGFTGIETLTYTLRDNNGGTAVTTVTITVNPLIPPPTPVNDAFTVVEDAAAAEFDVLVNDLPSQTGETLTVTRGTGAQGGSVTVNSANTRLIYAPRANFNGVELVTYTLQGSLGGITTGTVTFTVTAVNDPPDAVNDAINVLSQPNQTLNVLANDVNVDTGETLTIVSVTQPASGQGSVVISGSTLVYSAPNTDFEGTVSFTYTISDGNGLSDTANVVLTVRNFIPRTIGGSLASSNASTQWIPSGVAVSYSGLADTGTALSQSVIADRNGNFSIPNLAPGSYAISIAELPFLSGAASTTQVVSKPEDGNLTSVSLPVGTIQARFIDVRDFLGKAIGRGLRTAVANGQTQQWVAGNGAWQDFRQVSLSLDAAGNNLQIQATNATNQVLTGSVSVADPNLISVRATQGNSKLIRLLAHPSQLNLSTSSSTSVNVSGEGEASTDLAMAQVSSQLQRITPAADQIAANQGSTNVSSVEGVYAQDIEELMRENQR